MKKVCVVGHFGFGENMLNGQTIKTKTVTTELEKQLGADQVMKIDTHGGAKALPKITVQLINAFKNCKNIIIFPAHNGIKVFVPLCNAINRVFHRKLHYVVIGGWLPSLLLKNKGLTVQLRKFDGIYVETQTLEKALDSREFSNIYILPNFKDIKIVKESQLYKNSNVPYRLCTFSRVMKEKGIEDAVRVITSINQKYKKIIYELDIYGQIDAEQIDWFESLQKEFPPYIHYKGLVEANESVNVLRAYFALLFPTRFFTEGIPGTIIDGYASGTPVISSRWESFSDIIDEGETGLGYKFDDLNEFQTVLESVYRSPELIMRMRCKCLSKAEKYTSREALSSLLSNM